MASNNEVLIKLQADISNLQNGLKEAQSKIEGINGVAEKSMAGISSSMAKVGTAIAGAFAVGKIVDFGKTVVSTTATFSDSMLKVQALTGATGDEYNKLNDLALEYGSTTAHSSSDVADAMGYMALAGWNTTQIMEGLSGTLSLASAGQLDLATASDIVTDTMSMFNMEASECARASDVFAKTQASANTSVEQLGEGMKYAGATASAFGLSIEETSAMLGIMANNGIKASQGGTSLKNILSRLASPTAEVNKGFEALGFSQEDVAEGCQDLSSFLPKVKDAMSELSETEQVAVARNIAGAEAMSGFLAIVNSSTDALPELTDALNNSSGYAKETADTMEAGLGGAIRGLQSAWEGFILKIGQKIEAPLTDVINKLSECLNNLIPAVQEFWAKYGQLIKVLAISVTSFLAVKKIMLVLIPVVKTMKTVFSALKMIKSISGLFTVLKVAMSGLITCNPIILAVAGVVGVLAGAGYLIYKNWGSIKEFAVNMWNSVKETISGAWQGIKDCISSACKSISEFVTGIWNGIKETTASIWGAIKDFFVGIWEGLCSVVTNVSTAIWTAITSAWDSVYSYIKPVLELIRTICVAVWQGIQMAIATVVTIIATGIKFAWESIKTITTTIFNAVKTVITNVWNGIKKVVTTVIDFIKPYIEKAWNFIKDVTTKVFTAVKDFLTGIWNRIKEVVSTVVEAVKTKVSSVWNSIKERTSSIFNAVKDTVSSIWNGIKDKISDVVGKVKSLVVDGFNNVKDRVSSIFGGLKDSVMGIWQGIGSGIQGVVNGIIRVINGMVNAMNKISFTVPDWIPVMGGKSFGFNIPTVSEVSWFASGGIIKGTEGGSIVGVGEAGDEAIVPLSNKSRMKPFAEAVANMMPDNAKTSSESGGVVVQVSNLTVREEADVHRIAEELYRLQERNRRRRGVVNA